MVHRSNDFFLVYNKHNPTHIIRFRGCPCFLISYNILIRYTLYKISGESRRRIGCTPPTPPLVAKTILILVFNDFVKQKIIKILFDSLRSAVCKSCSKYAHFEINWIRLSVYIVKIYWPTSVYDHHNTTATVQTRFFLVMLTK